MMKTLNRLFSFPDSGSYDTKQKILILRVSAVTTLIMGLSLGLVNAFTGFTVLAFSLILLAGVSVFSLWSIRRGRLVVPSLLLPLGALVVMTVNLIVGGSLHEPGALIYPVVIVYASLLLGKRATLLFAGISILSEAIVFLAVSSGVVAQAFGRQENISGFIVTSFLIAITAGLLWVMLDFLDRSADRVRTSRERWRSLVENSPVAIVNTDLQGHIQFINRELPDPTLDLIGRTLQEFVQATDRERTLSLAQQVIDSGKSVRFETVGRSLDGQEAFYSVSAGPVFGLEGKVEGLTFILLDVTERKRIQDEVYRLNTELERLVQERTAQLETSNQELASFSYSISHDLRAPLRAIDGFSLALMEDYGDVLDEQALDFLARVRAASQRMGVLIDDLLRLARLTRQKIQTESFDLSALAITVANNIQAAHPERQVELIIQPGLRVSGNRDLLHIALDNLFSNAWKFTSGREPARIEFGCQEIDGLPTYFVRDNGMGFDMRYVDKLFQPFQHLHARSELIGSGIGLAITQRVIQKHGGKIWAEVQEGQGTTFYFTLSPR